MFIGGPLIALSIYMFTWQDNYGYGYGAVTLVTSIALIWATHRHWKKLSAAVSAEKRDGAAASAEL